MDPAGIGDYHCLSGGVRARPFWLYEPGGCVNLKPLTMEERARTLISLAHPDFREELTDQARQLEIFF